jgi:cytochrome c oxidase cbb3-type subunit 3
MFSRTVAMRVSARLIGAAALVAWMGTLAAAQRGGGPGAPTPAPQERGQTSPASQRPAQTKVLQEYPAAQVEAGRTQFASQCGFCHGRDAAGGAGGTDLTRSTLVAEDVRGDRLGPVIRSGRPAQGMPAFALSDAGLAAIVAFIHDQKRQADTASGGRRSVDSTDLQTGNAAAGKRYFDAACTRCHSATGDLAGAAARHQGLTLLQRMLYPSQAGRDGDASRVPQTVTVTLAAGQNVTGKLAYRDEFTIAMTDASGWYRAWPISQVKFSVDDPLQAHVEQLGKYTDDDMHDVLAYLQTLR